ncbi:MAG: B12-binding domain-containing radical SAM protein [Candidatus Lokiarchaeota archaeon]|nr:B12-binding domain-containing radical SAM protein [Candidatus Lokiarchaeota archaeon]MCK4481178.1 B12-binding domain-containing radical SAM protein [Candidatus Lokiarchaeota archaeon]
MKLIDKKIQRVALVNPNFITKSITDKFTIPALGLEYIAANILDLVKVKIIDAKVRNLDLKQIMEEINEFSPDIVGISCCFTIGINFALRIAKESKNQGYSVVLGGWHPSFTYSEVIKYSFVDVIVRGEGEITFREIVKNKNLNEIKGISFKDNGNIVNNPDRPLIRDLNKLPFPARKLRNNRAYFQIFQMPIDVIETSRGCPFNCTFCNIHLFYRGTYRTKSTERVIQELKIISSQNTCKNVLIVDDNFTANMKRVEEICDLIIAEDIKLDLICQSRIDVIKKNPNVIKKMSKAGFWLFFLGIESFNQKSLNEMEKKVQFRDIVEAIRILHDNDIVIIGSLLIGSSLNEEEKDTDLMIKMVKKLGVDFPLYSIMTPLPGTKFRDILIEKDYLLSSNWGEYNFTTAVNRLDKLSKDKLEQLLSKAYYYAYFNRGWKDTFIRLIKKKGLQFLFNSKKIFRAIKDFLNFFLDIRRMREKLEF